MQQVTSLRELEIALNLNGEMVVSKNHKNDLILMSMDEYNKKMLKDKIEKNLLKAEEDIENGKIIDAEDVFEEWKEEYGI